MPKPLQRVVYVDDEPHIRELARLSLERVGGFETRICASGQDALEAVADFRPDLLLLDVMMPDMDGPETLWAVRALPAFGDVPAIFVTAKAQPLEIERLLALGALSVISKPFAPLQLPNKLRAIWDQHNLNIGVI